MTASTLTDERVLITGGAGFIGTALARALVPQTTEVVLLDSLHPDVHGDDPQPPAIPGTSFVLGDVTSPQAWQQLLKGSRRQRSCTLRPRPGPVSRSPKRPGTPT